MSTKSGTTLPTYTKILSTVYSALLVTITSALIALLLLFRAQHHWRCKHMSAEKHREVKLRMERVGMEVENTSSYRETPRTVWLAK